MIARYFGHKAMLATWGCTTFPKPTLDLQFAGATSLDNRITFTRATTATFFNSSGVLTSAASGAARFDHNPTTLAPLGLLIEEQRTNSIRNNTMQGAVAGTPGTLPTNWATIGLGTLVQEVVGTGTENGITYIDLRFSGTTSSTSFSVLFESNSQIVAASGQTWSASQYVKLVAGNTTNITAVRTGIRGNISNGSTNESNLATFTPTSSLSRYTNTYTLANATSVFVNAFFNMTFSSGAAIDITLRIGLPQLELGAFATSVIPTTTTALTRNADAASMTGTNFSSWYNASEGTFVCEFAASANTDAFYLLASESGGFTVNSFYFDNNGGNIRNVVWSGSSPVSVLSTGAINTVSAINKLAGAYKANDFAVSRNGGSVVTDASGAVGVNINQLSIGRNPNNVANTFVSNTIRRIAYYPTRLPDAQLVALTG